MIYREITTNSEYPDGLHAIKANVLLNTLLVVYMLSIFYAPMLLHGRYFAYSYLPAWFFSHATILVALSEKRVHLSIYVVLYIIFSIFCLASIGWSIDPDVTFSRAVRVAAVAMVLPGIWLYCSSVDRINKFILTYVITAASAVLIGFFFNWSAAERQFLGVSSSAVAFTYGTAAIFSFLGWLINQKKQWLLLIPLFLSPIVAVGSVRGFVLILGVLAMYGLIRTARKLVRLQLFSFSKNFSIIALISVLILITINSSSKLTDRIDRNISTANEVLTEGYKIQNTGAAGLRLILIYEGIDYLRHNLTFFGKGLDASYSIYQDRIGMRAYSHTTYIDLLMGVGIFGTLLFYSMFFHFLFRLISKKIYPDSLIDGLISIVSMLLVFSLVARVFSIHHVMMLFVLIHAIYYNTKLFNVSTKSQLNPKNI
ncbi:hypothetical protein [Thiohalophilus thiocyanatoxydans]|uniref:O-antigen ligase n=1 Tax=Thiohalophilus thiocyanatoxydans TaxID=381308 RepID=A0A4R8IP54_9GAMM|nr:hypothetical protein [Thiohalophilus thiocyanatoxydans]TDY02686.1 hypothetical protein EDC23_1063 [Thiohalophilus thiocyanatoxydans]